MDYSAGRDILIGAGFLESTVSIVTLLLVQCNPSFLSDQFGKIEVSTRKMFKFEGEPSSSCIKNKAYIPSHGFSGIYIHRCV